MNYTTITVPAPGVTADQFPFYTEQDQWCITQFGMPHPGDKYDHWYMITGYGKLTGFFKNPEHATLFALRWL